MQIAATNDRPLSLCINSQQSLKQNIHNVYLISEQKVVTLLKVCLDMLRNPLLETDMLRIIILKIKPFLKYDNSTLQLEGIIGDIWNVLVEMNDLKYNITVGPSFGNIMRTMQKGKIDVYVGPAAADTYRSNLEYFQPYIKTWNNLYIKLPDLKINPTYYIKPFSFNLWILTWISFLFLSAFIYMAGRTLRKINPSEPLVSLPICFLGTISGFINQGCELKFSSYSVRILIYISLILGLLLYVAMNALLYSQMTVFRITTPVETLTDVMKQTKLTLCIRNMTYVYGTYIVDKNDVIKPEWKQIVNRGPCKVYNKASEEAEDIANVICRDDVVIMENIIVMSSFLKKHRPACNVIKLRKNYFSTSNTFFALKYLKQSESIKRSIIKLKSSGVMSRIINKYLERTDYENIIPKKWYPITINHVGGILGWYFLMIVLSLFILFIEIICKKRSARIRSIHE
ncbi:unnamed protein product [Phyllotreta striolata]|uniref:Ionotropic glutamate receptor C-terminal domain-containing protein n=1 Tax=Phyllotreta striolata TaxID=444603 RepID=A0A9N9TQC2_PHYSR|nr:unnamed protein product [Phyllotreta striolata]